ncbi:response regulator [Thiovibrio frasassiensis]|jgi:CheY-like chemotaxis protein|uniref:Response regulator n=1 Tax=Thiovibrio frasassiensis TaxID=2984131 RepID=A0A9X4ME81_9BACT|nr:response regulator [Thiovibrio frasassiensis]MDG4474685.1 response regulator [Thiovibrio frasassiensis]
MKKVLVVDDDHGFLLSLQDMCRERVDSFEIVTAGNGKEALAVLGSQPVHLVVTDLKMPEMDGFELVSRMSRLRNSVPVIAMTAFGTPEMEDRLMNLGAFQYIEKPVDFELLLQKIKDGLAAGAKGHVSGVSLSSFLQLLELDRKTCTIMARAGARTGLLFFENGSLINAYAEPLVGLDAAFEIISWEQAEIEIYNFCQNRKQTIDAPLGFILIEGARLSDERGDMPAQAAGERDDEFDHLEDLDFATSPLPPAGAAMAAALAQGGRASLEETLNAVQGVNRVVLVAKDGTVRVQRNIDNKEFKPFVTYVAVAADKIRGILGYGHLPSHIILSQEKGEQLLIIPGTELSVGIEVESGVSPTKIVAAIGPALAEAQQLEAQA